MLSTVAGSCLMVLWSADQGMEQIEEGNKHIPVDYHEE